MQKNRNVLKQEIVSKIFNGICEFNSIQGALVAEMPERIEINYLDGTKDVLMQDTEPAPIKITELTQTKYRLLL